MEKKKKNKGKKKVYMLAAQKKPIVWGGGWETKFCMPKLKCRVPHGLLISRLRLVLTRGAAG